MEHYSTEFCQMELHNNFAILIVNENTTLTIDRANIVRKKLRDFYKSQNFSMISYRKFNHEVDTGIYDKGQLKNMKALAIVSSKQTVRDKALIEQKLYDKSFAFFETLEDAKSWAETYF